MASKWRAPAQIFIPKDDGDRLVKDLFSVSRSVIFRAMQNTSVSSPRVGIDPLAREPAASSFGKLWTDYANKQRQVLDRAEATELITADIFTEYDARLARAPDLTHLQQSRRQVAIQGNESAVAVVADHQWADQFLAMQETVSRHNPSASECSEADELLMGVSEQVAVDAVVLAHCCREDGGESLQTYWIHWNDTLYKLDARSKIWPDWVPEEEQEPGEYRIARIDPGPP